MTKFRAATRAAPTSRGTEPKTKPKATPGTDGDDTGAGGTEPGDLGELTSWPRGKAVSDPDAMNKPLLLVEYEGRRLSC